MHEYNQCSLLTHLMTPHPCLCDTICNANVMFAGETVIIDDSEVLLWKHVQQTLQGDALEVPVASTTAAATVLPPTLSSTFS